MSSHLKLKNAFSTRDGNIFSKSCLSLKIISVASSTSLALILYYAPTNKSLKDLETSELKTTFVQSIKPTTIDFHEQLKLKHGEEMDIQLNADLYGESRWGTDYQPYVMLYKPSNSYFLMGK